MTRILALSGKEQIEEYVKHLNNFRWVADSGRPYFVNKRQRADGTIEHFVDRNA